MDIRMPDMDGLAAIATMKRRSLHTSVIIITTYSSMQYLVRARAPHTPRPFAGIDQSPRNQSHLRSSEQKAPDSFRGIKIQNEKRRRKCEPLSRKIAEPFGRLAFGALLTQQNKRPRVETTPVTRSYCSNHEEPGTRSQPHRCRFRCGRKQRRGIPGCL